MELSNKLYNDGNHYLSKAPAMRMWEQIDMQLEMRRHVSDLLRLLEAEEDEESAEKRPEMTDAELRALLRKAARPTKWENDSVSDEEHNETIEAVKKVLSHPTIADQLHTFHPSVGDEHGATIGTSKTTPSREETERAKASDVAAAFMTGTHGRNRLTGGHRASMSDEPSSRPPAAPKRDKKGELTDKGAEEQSKAQFLKDLGVQKGGRRSMPIQKVIRSLLHHDTLGETGATKKLSMDRLASYMRSFAKGREKDAARAASKADARSTTGKGQVDSETGERGDRDIEDKGGAQGEVTYPRFGKKPLRVAGDPAHKTMLKDILRAVKKAQKDVMPLKRPEQDDEGHYVDPDTGKRVADLPVSRKRVKPQSSYRSPEDPNIGKVSVLRRAKKALLEPGANWPAVRRGLQSDPDASKDLGTYKKAAKGEEGKHRDMKAQRRTTVTRKLAQMHKDIVSHPAVKSALKRHGINLGQADVERAERARASGKTQDRMSMKDLRAFAGLGPADDSPDYDASKSDAEADRRRERDKDVDVTKFGDELKKASKPTAHFVGTVPGTADSPGRTIGRKRYSGNEGYRAGLAADERAKKFKQDSKEKKRPGEEEGTSGDFSSETGEEQNESLFYRILGAKGLAESRRRASLWERINAR